MVEGPPHRAAAVQPGEEFRRQSLPSHVCKHVAGDVRIVSSLMESITVRPIAVMIRGKGNFDRTLAKSPLCLCLTVEHLVDSTQGHAAKSLFLLSTRFNV